MKVPKLLRQFGTHLCAVGMGALLAFGGFHSLSSQAGPMANLISAKEQVQVAKAPALPGGDSFVAAAVSRTGPAVVRIDTETVVTRRTNPIFEDPFFQEFFGGQFRGRVPEQQERRVTGQGSGFIVDSNGVILTNAHVVSKADKVTVTLKDGRTFDGQVRGTDNLTDLAVVKIDPRNENIPVAPLGNSNDMEVGDWAIAVGNPMGLDSTVTLGIVSTLGRSAAEAGIPDKRIDFIQTDAAINPGNSGGPLLNDRGEVIGINTAIRANAMGIGFAIPINTAKSLEKTLAAGKEVPHPYIGVQMINLTPEIARENNEDPNSPFIIPEIEGILVVRVIPDSPAQKAGIRRGDVITAANGTAVTDGAELQAIVEKAGINKNVKIELQRGDRSLSLGVTTEQLASQ